MDMTFSTKITSTDISIDEVGYILSSVTLKWGVTLSANSSCLKDISALVPDQDITVRYEEESLKEDGEMIEKEKTISLKDVEVEYDWNHEDRNSSLGLGLCSQSIEVYKGKVTVTFSTGSL